MKAIFSPGPSYSNPEVRKYAGWVHIFDLYREGLEELGYEVFVPEVDPKLIDQSSTVSKILSYDIVAAQQIPGDAELFLGPPGYSRAQMIAGRDNNWGRGMKNFLYVWNNADWWRDKQLAEEYKRFNQPYDLSLSWRWINRTALEMCDHVIACSPWVKKTHARVVPEDKISIAFWGVDSEKFHPPDVEPEGFRVLFVGGDPIRKGLHYLFRALEGMENVELWVVGCSPIGGGSNIVGVIGEPGKNVRVKQFGMLPHDRMPEIYQQCHVLCLPTLEDGIALAVQESMSCGLVPVTSPETSEVFDDEDSGFRVGYRAVESIREKLEWLQHDNLRRGMSIRARERAVKDTWEITKEQFKEIIRKEINL